ncbi:HD domain-containing protein [Thermoanaerobacter sp. AC272]|nr:HD domain-containing protein [Thermoanaerobacter sp. CM-CNRG TB177]
MDHPVMSYEIINKMKVMENIAKIIRHHHERYDGKGYSDGLKGKEIPLGSRIIAVADSFDAMTSKRPYRDSFTMAQAIEELKKNAGTQFDPKIVDAFISVIENLGIDY